jgi:Nucleoside diphosphate kinase
MYSLTAFSTKKKRASLTFHYYPLLSLVPNIRSTIRGDFCIEVGRNICHGSDSVESAEKEIALWFPEGISEWNSCSSPWVYEG